MFNIENNRPTIDLDFRSLTSFRLIRSGTDFILPVFATHLVVLVLLLVGTTASKKPRAPPFQVRLG